LRVNCYDFFDVSIFALPSLSENGARLRRTGYFAPFVVLWIIIQQHPMPTLEWLTREEDVRKAAHVPYRLLEEVPDLSYGANDTGNMLIQGDNLEALKALLPFYAGRVKCIFIDPPYNTRSAFEHYDDNLEHTQWLAMMYPRLEMLRELLAEDGSIWVTIDDNEAHYLKVIMDEIFGRKNFVANVVWQKKYAPQNNAIWLSDSHDHILLYARNKTVWRPRPLARSADMDARYRNPDNDVRGIWKASDFTISLSGGQRGAQYARTGESENIYEITTPTGRKLTPAKGRCWAATPSRYKELLTDNRIWFGSTGNNVPALKRFLHEVQDGVVAKTVWLRSEVGDNQDAKREGILVSSNEVFATPKPEALIARILELASAEKDLVLDSFLGSGTTAAVAQKTRRSYIGIEMGEHAITHCVPRLQKVIDGEQGGISKAVEWKSGGGFSFFKLGPTVFDEEGRINPAVRFDHLAAHIWFSETRTPLHRPRKRSPFLGSHDGIGYYLLFNGILGDKRPDGGNVLTRKLLAEMPSHDGPRVIYGESSRIMPPMLKRLGITFKQTPYDVRAR
jgi:adenine-specific DNA-methyltransferase